MPKQTADTPHGSVDSNRLFSGEFNRRIVDLTWENLGLTVSFHICRHLCTEMIKGTGAVWCFVI